LNIFNLLVCTWRGMIGPCGTPLVLDIFLTEN